MARYSHSQIALYEKCPLQYAYRYVEKIDPPAAPSLHLILGTSVHYALEVLYKKVGSYQKPTLEDCLKRYQEKWEEEKTAAEQKVSNTFLVEDLTVFYDRGVKYIERYFASYQPFDQAIPIEVEKNISFSIGGDDTMRGVVDRIDKDKKDLIIVDYKTNRHLPTDQKDTPKEQLTLYGLAIKNDWGSKYDRLFAKLIYLHMEQEYTREITPEMLADIQKKYQTVVDEINQKKSERALCQGLFSEKKNKKLHDVFPAIQGSYCAYCPFQEICPHFSHLIADDEVVDGSSLKEETVQSLVDKYAKLSQEIKTLEDEKKILKEALVQYAIANDYKKLYGKEFQVPVIDKIFSSIDPEKEQDAIAILKEKGAYDDLAKINGNSLSSALKKDPDLLPEDMIIEKRTAYLSRASKKKE